jgi:transcriptional regulator GlxA family with amidase domain
LRFVTACHARCRRIASVCSGTYLLAAAGVLEGKRATTHWSRTRDLQAKYPRVCLDADRIYVKSGKVWTSAGITAGIDLALALIGEDLGERVSRRVAQQMVVYHRRPGGQSQFSPLLELEPADERFANVVAHMRTHLRGRLAVADLAARANMSPRHFAREFRAATGITPAKAVERMRADAARAALDSGKRSIQEIARTCGFGAPERMRRTFVRMFGGSPSALKRQAK